MINVFFEWQDRLTVIAVLYARIAPIFMIVPVLNTSVLGNLFIRNVVIFVIILGLWPTVSRDVPALQANLIEYLALLLKETIVGSTIGFVLALPFWIFNAFGAFIDVARGSSMGSMLDPTSGQESTEIQNFINFCVCAVYFEFGGIKLLLESLVKSFQDITLKQDININLETTVLFMGQIFAHGFVLAAPVLLTLLLSEALLGLLSRFTPQLSAFSISMAVKSTIAIFILSLYFWQILPEHLTQFINEYSQWNLIKGINPK